MFYGSAVAVLVIAVGLTALVNDGIKSRPLESAASTEDERDQVPVASAADIELRTRNLGGLRLGIQARVTMNKSRSELEGARVDLFLDMVQMPQAHSMGPIRLQPTERPGVYTTVTTVPMLGDYKIRAEMNDPVHAEMEKVVQVSTIPRQK